MTPAFLHLKLLGPLEARLDGQRITGYRSHKSKWMLGFLALQNEAEVEYDLLAHRFWPNPEAANSRLVDKRALDSVRQCVSNLGKILGPERLLKRGKSSVRLLLSDAQVDVFDFDAAIAKNTPASLQEAIRLYSGDLLDGCPDAWSETPRELRRQSYREALQRLAEAAVARLDYSGAETYLRVLVSTDRLRQAPRRDLMLLLARQGEYSAALVVYRQWRALVEPQAADAETEMRALYRTIQKKLANSPTGDAEAAVSPQPLYRLPGPLATLVGRETVLEMIHARISFARMVTLKGPPGVGKTQLAIHAAQLAHDDFPGGIVFVDLSDAAESDALWQEIASALHLNAPIQHRAQAIINLLQDRRFLLILDNCEQIVAEGASLVRRLLLECPYLHILTTSRTAWRRNLGEKVIAVAPLAIPPVSIRRRAPTELVSLLLDWSAVRLFVEEAVNVQSDFALTPENAWLVAQLCRQLDGLPLAIQLMAGWAHTLSPAEMLAALTDGKDLLRAPEEGAPARHTTLLATIEISYSLLAPPLQRFLLRLAVFQNGWTHEAAGAVCEEPRTLDYLRELQERSLVISQASEQTRRFRFLETVLRFARVKLADAPDAESVRSRHLDYYLRLAESAEPGISRSEQALWLDRLEREHGNLRVALATAQRQGEFAKGLRLAGVLWRFWYIRGHNAEGAVWLERFLRRAQDALPAVRARALGGAGNLALQRGDYPLAKALLTQRLEIEAKAGNLRVIAATLGNLANIASYQHDVTGARALFERSLALFRTLEDQRGIALTLGNLVVIADMEDDLEQSLAYNLESIGLLRQLEDWQNLAMSLNNLADTLMKRHDVASAVAAVQEGLAISRQLNSAHNLIHGLFLAFCLAVDQGRVEVAAVLLGAGEALRESAGLPLNPRAEPQLEQHRALILLRLGDSRFEEAVALGRRMSTEEAVEFTQQALSEAAPS